MLGTGEVVWGGRAVRVITDMEVGVLVLELDTGDEDVVGGIEGGNDSMMADVALVVAIGAGGAAGVCGGYGHQ